MVAAAPRARVTRPRADEPAERRARVERMLARVEEAGIKLTTQRLAVVQELAADETHPTAQELFERLSRKGPGLSFATVYNTLDALTGAGICAVVSLAPGAARFDPNMGEHHHAVCDGCGLVRDMPPATDRRRGGERTPREGASVPLAPGFELRSIERIYRGLCATCAKKRPRSR
jgi:Fe2+ or Zn2+ uptake regulation protein